jgi:hypothetical protein
MAGEAASTAVGRRWSRERAALARDVPARLIMTDRQDTASGLHVNRTFVLFGLQARLARIP